MVISAVSRDRDPGSPETGHRQLHGCDTVKLMSVATCGSRTCVGRWKGLVTRLPLVPQPPTSTLRDFAYARDSRAARLKALPSVSQLLPETTLPGARPMNDDTLIGRALRLFTCRRSRRRGTPGNGGPVPA